MPACRRRSGGGGAHVTLLCESGKGYANLCRILTAAHAGTRRTGRGGPRAAAALRPARDRRGAERGARLPLRLRARRARAPRPDTAPRGSPPRSAGSGSSSSCSVPYERGDARRHAALRDLAEHLGVETVATGDVHAHHPRRTLLQDVLVAIRCRTSLDGCEPERRGNREAVLRAPAEMVERFPGLDRAAAERTRALAERLEFDLTEELGYRYPDFSDGDEPAIRQLAAICDHAFGERYGASGTVLRAKARARLDGELALIERARPRRLLPPPPRGARARAGVRARGARAATRRGASCRRGAGGGAPSARSSATSPASRTSTRSRTSSRSGAS